MIPMKSVRKAVYNFMTEGITATEKTDIYCRLESCNEIWELEAIMEQHGYEEPAATILELIVDETK